MPNDPTMEACEALVASGRAEWFTDAHGQRCIRLTGYGRALAEQKAALKAQRVDEGGVS